MLIIEIALGIILAILIIQFWQVIVGLGILAIFIVVSFALFALLIIVGIAIAGNPELAKSVTVLGAGFGIFAVFGMAISFVQKIIEKASKADDKTHPSKDTAIQIGLPNMNTLACLHISVTIQRNLSEVYDFISDPRNLPKWASGLAQGLVMDRGDVWIAESPMGKVKIRFAEKNSFGIADHDVTLDSGETIHNPLRVLKNGDGSEVVFTLFRQSTMTDASFNKDARTVEKDLNTLKRLLEGA